MAKRWYRQLPGDDLEDDDEIAPPLVTKKLGLDDQEQERFDAWWSQQREAKADDAEAPAYYTTKQVNKLIQEILDAVDNKMGRAIAEEREAMRNEIKQMITDLRKDLEISELKKEIAKLKGHDDTTSHSQQKPRIVLPNSR